MLLKLCITFKSDLIGKPRKIVKYNKLGKHGKLGKLDKIDKIGKF